VSCYFQFVDDPTFTVGMANDLLRELLQMKGGDAAAQHDNAVVRNAPHVAQRRVSAGPQLLLNGAGGLHGEGRREFGAARRTESVSHCSDPSNWLGEGDLRRAGQALLSGDRW
jgi:hypothetical protein